MWKQLLVVGLLGLILVAGATTAVLWGARAAVANIVAGDDDPVISLPGDTEPAPANPSASPAPYEVPTPTYIAHRLVAGEQLITDAQISDYYLAQSPAVMGDLANTMLAIHEGQIEVRCMAKKGWWFDPRYMSGPRSDTPAGLALMGDTGAGDAYRWQDAGCYGLAVHETGATS